MEQVNQLLQREYTKYGAQARRWGSQMIKKSFYQSFQVPSTMTKGGCFNKPDSDNWSSENSPPSPRWMCGKSILNNRFYRFRLPSITHLVEVPNYFFFNLHWFCPIWKLENAFSPCLPSPLPSGNHLFHPSARHKWSLKQRVPFFLYLLPLVVSQGGMPQLLPKRPNKVREASVHRSSSIFLRSWNDWASQSEVHYPQWEKEGNSQFSFQTITR